ncbi:oligosaccharide flippase family protein [Curtobacterium sp. MCBA15_012]|uniref:oligosaccharide flippase family protein n=1 Tax=Curtobacterium sp. MCBA15_012 TaxID=1898738 RepID=UPI0009F27A4C|nr:oligosaccharide flippase family protein [Curtobacterium sp. MCBA15_012]WIB00730.1 oligosaccharide flippase family protein [Curtobacterium sp. MCBA15_012]
MSTFALASRGAGLLLVTQAVIGGGQFLYSAATARLFSPAEFGSFVAVLGLQGLLILATTTGLPSLVLHRPSLSRSDLRWLRLYALIGGVLAAAAFVLAWKAWATLLNASYAFEFVPLLTASLLVFPIASVESALLRREGRATADAISLLAAFVVPAVVAISGALLYHEPWALALVPVVNALTLGTIAFVARTKRYTRSTSTAHREFLQFTWNVSRQNIVFYLIAQLPGWTLSATSGARTLGAFNRATSLTQSLSNPLTVALNRATQPHWRRLSDKPVNIQGAMLDSTSLSCAASFTLFAVVAALGTRLAPIWLGPGWDQVGILVPGLAIAAALQVPFSLLAASLEMRGMFAHVRRGQIGLATGTSLTLLALFLFHDPIWASLGLAFAQALGLIALVRTIAGGRNRYLAALLRRILMQLLWSCVIGLSAFAGAAVATTLKWDLISDAALTQCLAGATAALFTVIILLRWHPVLPVLHRRGVRLPRILVRETRRSR